MTISIWRYSHLTLAVSSFVFICLASITGLILAFEPISEQVQPYKVAGFEDLNLGQTLAVFKKNYAEVIALEVDANQFVSASVITHDGKNMDGYFNPITAEYLGKRIEKSAFFQFTTNLHRSLFLKGLGRFFVGLCSFLLFLIAVSGTALILKRQGGIKQFFSRVINENFAQYYHVILGRLSLIPIIIITLTGVYLSLLRFDMLPQENSSHDIDFETISAMPKQDPADFLIFKNTKLSEVKAVEFPFSNDVEDYYTIQLKDREVVVNQFNGFVLSEIKYPWVAVLSALSISLHTGQGSILWSLILAIACINILFFIYSGFAMTLKRRKARLKNKFKKENSEYIILVGSENGSTVRFANALHQALLKAGKKSFITEFNAYTTYANVKHIIGITATYGQGEAPANANKFLSRLPAVQQENEFSFSVVGFGSFAYPDFCQFAFDVDHAFQNQINGRQILEPFTINDKSVETFEKWVSLWSAKTGIRLDVDQKQLVSKPKNTQSFTAIHKTDLINNPDNTFLLSVKPNSNQSYASGDLLAVYPKNDHRERLYSIGKVNGNIQLSIKYYDQGLGSTFLIDLAPEIVFKARIIRNPGFHFPKKGTPVVLIGNGTGIAPFLGMLDQNTQKTATHLYLGLRTEKSLGIYQEALNQYVESNKLTQLNFAYSQQGAKTYVQDLLQKDADFIAQTLRNRGTLMICGSLAMQKGVFEVIETIIETHQLDSLIAYQKKGQLKTDCY